MKAMQAKSLLPNWGLLSDAPISNCTKNLARKTRPTSRLGWKFSRMTTVPSLRQPHMPSAPPISSVRKPPRRFPRPAPPNPFLQSRAGQAGQPMKERRSTYIFQVPL